MTQVIRDSKKYGNPQRKSSQLRSLLLQHYLEKRLRSTRLTDYIILTEPIGDSSGNIIDTGTSPKVHLRRQYFEASDMAIEEIKTRFTDLWLYQALSAMSALSCNFLDIDSLKPFRTLQINIPSREELVVCKVYLERITKEEERHPNSILVKLFEQREAYPAVYQLAATIATFGSSQAVCEASFSTLKRVNSPPTPINDTFATNKSCLAGLWNRQNKFNRSWCLCSKTCSSSSKMLLTSIFFP